jgi:Tfp pilus assembly protein PilP
MKIFSRQIRIVYLIIISVFFIVCPAIHAADAPGAAPSQDTGAGGAPAGENADSALAATNATGFKYRMEGRMDPFAPFISDKTEEGQNPNDIVEGEEQLTGMQLFEPGQLTLVALVATSDQKFAMVQDVTGKGYVVKEGTKIGRRGIVQSILPNKVIIEEIATTRAGTKLTSETVMVLRKEEKNN